MALLFYKKLFAFLRGNTLKHVGYFHCLNYLHSSRAKSKLESHKKVFGNIFMALQYLLKSLELNQYQKSDETQSIIYADHRSLIKKNRWMLKIILNNNHP